MWMGEMTHKILSWYLTDLKRHLLHDGLAPDKERIITMISQNMKRTFDFSAQNDYTNFVDFWLSEHYYQEIDENAFQAVVDKVVSNLEAFIVSDYHKRIEQRFRKWHHIYIEDPRRPDFEMMRVDVRTIPWLEKVSIMASPDFGLMFGDNHYLILDRKSGKESLDTSWITDQLRVYSLKTLLKQGSTQLEDRHIDVYEVYLPSLHEKSGTIEQQDIDHIIAKILDDVEYQKQFIVDQDVEKNEALSHSSFARTTSEKKCLGCTFREVCQKLKSLEV
jgi:hypothetical protein